MKRANVLLTMMWVGLTACGLAPGYVAAASQERPAGNAPLQQSYVWYDRDQPRQVWIDPNLLAEFNGDASRRSQVRQVYPVARELPARQRALRIWQLPEGVNPEVASRTLNTRDPAARYSPVLHDAPAPSGRKRALPGNVIVYLNPAWDQATVEQWARGRDLTIVTRVDVQSKNVVVIKTGPGLDALETANRLYQSGEVVAAFPNWWQETVTR